MPAIVCRKNSGGPVEIHNFSQQIVDLLGIVKKYLSSQGLPQIEINTSLSQ